MAVFGFVKNEELTAVSLDWYGVGSFFRRNGDWHLIAGEEADDAYLVYISPDRAMDFVERWDDEDSELFKDLDQYAATEEQLTKLMPYATKDMSPEALTAAAERSGGCPPATQDIVINTKNRNKAINSLAYGPLNPDRPNVDFWEEKGKLWQTTADEAKTSRCANCAMFIKTPEMLECISEGIGSTKTEDSWDIIDAGDLGYCEALDFKCAAGRTCDAWVAGGPVTGKEDK